MSRILVLGAAGMLGLAVSHHLRRQQWEVLALTRTQFNALRHSPADLPLEGCRAVVNAAGLINRRLGQAPESDFWRVNGVFPRQLADACQNRGVPLIHVSTDCVFSGHGAPHIEQASADAADLYGMSKAAGEPRNACVIRTSIIGPEWQRRDSLMAWFMNQPGPVQGYTHHLWNGVTTLQLAQVIHTLLLGGHDRHQGIRHIHGHDITKHDLLVLMAQRLNHPVPVLAAQPGEPRDTRLATSDPAFLQALGVKPMAQQLDDIAPLCGPEGQWLGDVPAQP